MTSIYVAINGDGVGEAIGSSIASDDQKSLRSKSNAIKEIHKQIDSWFESSGGEVITSSGDEGIYLCPEECLEHLENLRQQYEEHTGHTLTIGIGESMSEAAKALIYGKMSEKNVIVEYRPEMEEAISQQDDMGPRGYEAQNEPHLPGQEDIQYQRDRHAEKEQGMVENLVEDEEESDQDAEEIIEDATHDPEHEKGMSEEEEKEHDAAENEADEADDDIIEADEEAEGMGVDGVAGEEDMQVDEDESDTESESNEEDHADLIAEMIHAHMSGEEEEEGEEMPDEEMPDEEMPDEEMPDEEMNAIREDIVSSLSEFKQNREMILQMEQAAPEMYNSLMTMLRSMIAMAKKLGMNPTTENQQEEGGEEMQEPMEMSEKK